MFGTEHGGIFLFSLETGLTMHWKSSSDVKGSEVYCWSSIVSILALFDIFMKKSRFKTILANIKSDNNISHNALS